MKYRHRFQIRAPLEQVAAFHFNAGSLKQITPPPVIVRLHQAPERMEENAEMRFTLWLGPIPLPWRARFESISAAGFTDRQLAGPFRSWAHRHSFQPADNGCTWVMDEIEATIKLHPWWGPIGLGMWLSLPVLFVYRQWKTRRLLEK